MKKILLSVVLFFYVGMCLAQADTVFIQYNQNDWDDSLVYTNDTVVFPTPNARMILHGTMALPTTDNQEQAKNYGLYLHGVSQTNCRQSMGKTLDLTTEVIALKRIGDSLSVEIKYTGNCCHSFLCDVQIQEDSIVNLLVYGYGKMWCFCECCFGLNFQFTTMPYGDPDKLKKVMINGNRATLKDWE